MTNITVLDNERENRLVVLRKANGFCGINGHVGGLAIGTSSAANGGKGGTALNGGTANGC